MPLGGAGLAFENVDVATAEKSLQPLKDPKAISRVIHELLYQFRPVFSAVERGRVFWGSVKLLGTPVARGPVD